MDLAQRLSLVAALAVFGATACKKESSSEKTPDPAEAAKPTAAPTGAAGGTAAPAAGDRPAQPAAALAGFQDALAKAGGGKAGGGKAGAGMLGDLGGRFGGLGGVFGGGKAAAAPGSAPAAPAAAAATGAPAAGGAPALADARFPPPAAKGGDCAAVADRAVAVLLSYVASELGGMRSATCRRT